MLRARGVAARSSPSPEHGSLPMKFVTFSRDDVVRSGALLTGDLAQSGDLVLDFDHEDSGLPEAVGPLDWADTGAAPFRAAEKLVGGLDADRVAELGRAGVIVPLAEVELLSPIPRPGKVICIGLNYRDHAAESGLEVPEWPLVFSKFSSCVVGPEVPVILPPGDDNIDYEAELGVVIGREACRVSEEEAMDYVLGYCNINDVSARGFQFKDGQWQRAKSCDTFCPTGPFIATRDEIADPHKLRISFRMNGETLQDSSTEQLIFNIPELIAHLSTFVTLEPGDLISTGTPPGVGFARKPPVYLKSGDQMEVEIEGLGVLANPVA